MRYPRNLPSRARGTTACIRYTSEAVAVRRSVLRGVEALVPASFSERGQFVEILDGRPVGEQRQEVDDRPVVVLFFVEVVNPLVVGAFGVPGFVGLGQETDPAQESAAGGCDGRELETGRLQQVMTRNLLRIVAQKALFLNRKIEFLSRRTTREKLLAYLSAQARAAGSRQFTIPFNRQELADFLCVERSAMSAELGRMKRDGLLDFERRTFRLL